MSDDNRFVIYGPNHDEPVPNITVGRELYEVFSRNDVKNPAMVDAITGEKLFYPDLLQKTVNLATALRILHYDTEDTVLTLSSENNLQFFIPVIASLYNRSTMATLSHHYTTTELRHTVNLSKPRLVFCSEAVVDKFLQLKKEFNYIERIILTNATRGKKYVGVETVDEFVQIALEGRNMDPRHFQPVDRDATKAISFVLCSSGTTGLPKGVMLSHTNIFVRILHSRDSRYAPTQEKTAIGILPFFHGYGLISSIEHMSNSKTIVVLRQFDEDVFLKTLQDFKIRALTIAPPLALFLAKSPKVNNYDLSLINEVICGAAPLSLSVEETLVKKFKLKGMRQGYGLTEATMAVMIMPSDEIKLRSVGTTLPYMLCKVRDPETGRSLGPNEVGEICLKGPMLMLGYFGDTKSTNESFTSDGWLKTGDLGYYDQDKYFYVVDRLKELIKYKGFQVAPAELEALLVRHEKILDAAVVGVSDDLCGELPLAFVVKQDGAQLTEEDVQKYIADLVSPQKRLSGGVKFVQQIPKNPSGKILRRILREQVKKLTNTPKSHL